MVEKGIRGGTCHAIQPYLKTNIKYMKNYNKNKESSYLMYHLDASNLYRLVMLEKLLVENVDWEKNKSKFVKSYDENSYEGYIFEVDAGYPKELQKKNNDLPFLPKK